MPHLRTELKCLYMIYTMDYLMKDGVGFRAGGIINTGDGVEWSFERSLRYWQRFGYE